MNLTKIPLAHDTDGLPASVIAEQLAEDTAMPPVIDKEWRLYVCWARSSKIRPLPMLSNNDEAVAVSNAALASKLPGVRYIAVHTGPSAYPAALYVDGARLDDEAAEEALLAEAS